jgi:hypothetical protein
MSAGYFAAVRKIEVAALDVPLRITASLIVTRCIPDDLLASRPASVFGIVRDIDAALRSL